MRTLKVLLDPLTHKMETRSLASPLVSGLSLTLLVALASGCGSAQPTPAPAPDPATPPVVAPVPVTPPSQVQPVAPGIAGCLNLQPSTPISFSGNGIYMDSVNLVGGMIPSVVPYFGGKTYGTMALSTTVTQGPFQDDPRSLDDGTINMNIIPNTPGAAPTSSLPMGGTMPSQPGCIAGTQGCVLAPAYGSGMGYGQNTANVNGTFSVSVQAYQDIVYKISTGQIPGSNVPVSTPIAQVNNGTSLNSAICVTGIAIDLGYKQTTLYGGYVFLYLNQSQHGYILHF